MPRPVPQQTDQEKIQGTWKPVSARRYGKELPDLIIKSFGPTITFAGNKVTWKANPTPEAKDLLERAMSLSSMFLDYQWSHIATIRYFCGDYEGVLRAADRSKNVIVDTPGWKAAALQQLGRTDEARDALMQLYSAVARIWEGGRAATHQDVLRWYCSAFPIKHEEDRGLLAKLRLLV